MSVKVNNIKCQFWKNHWWDRIAPHKCTIQHKPKEANTDLQHLQRWTIVRARVSVTMTILCGGNTWT